MNKWHGKMVLSVEENQRRLKRERERVRDRAEKITRIKHLKSLKMDATDASIAAVAIALKETQIMHFATHQILGGSVFDRVLLCKNALRTQLRLN